MSTETEHPGAIIPRRAVKYGLILTAIIAVAGSAIGYLVAGPTGLVSALLGAALTAVFMGLTAVSFLVALRVTKGDGASPLFYGIVLGVWVVKLVVFVLLLVILRGQEWLDARVMFVVVLVAVLGSLIVDVLAFVRSRVPYVDPGKRRLNP